MRRLNLVLAAITLFAGGFAAGAARLDMRVVAWALGVRLQSVGPRLPRADTLVVADSLYGRCSRLEGHAKTTCYQTQLLTLRKQRGTRFAMGTLNRLSVMDRDVELGGHDYTHLIGITAFKESRDVRGAFKSCTEILQSGCYHGVIQTYLLSVPRVGPDEVRAVCQEYANPAANQWLRFQCVHGMGHGLTMYHGHDLRLALEGCDLLETGWDRQSCYGGAFMENIIHVQDPGMAHMVMGDAADTSGGSMDMAGLDHGATTMDGHPQDTTLMAGHDHGAMQMSGAMHHAAAAKFAPIDSTDPFYPCSRLGERYQADCWRMQPAVILFLRNNDFRRTFQACDSAPARWRQDCYAGTGTDVSGQTARNHQESIRLCSTGSPRYQPWCYEGVVKNFIDVTADYRDGLAFCKVIPGQRNQLHCYQSVGEEIAVLRNGLAARAPLCNEIQDPSFRDACLFGAQVNATPPAGSPMPEGR